MSLLQEGNENMKRLIFGVSIIVFALTGQLRANIIFSTLGPGDAYNTDVGWTIGYSGSLFDQGDQFSFTGPSSFYLDSIDLAVSLVSGTNELEVWLMADDN